MRRNRPLLPLLLFAFFYFLAIGAVAQHASHEGVAQQQPLQQDHRAAKSAVADRWLQTGREPGRTPDNDAQQAAEKVRAATSILRKIKPPTISKLTSYTHRPKGFVGSAIYYVKEVFLLLFMSAPRPSALTTTPSRTPPKLSQPLSTAVKLLQDAARNSDPEALYLLAEMNFYGNYSYPIDYDEAFRRYHQLADLNGNSTAQYMLGFLYATGLSPSIPSDQAKSMLYHTFAAEQGETRSEMTLAFRNHAGIATPRNCDESVHWYRRVADKAVQYYRSGPPGGHALVRDAYRLADEEGGVYGEGASVSSAGANAKVGGPTSDQYADIEDVLEYLHMQSGKGDLKATFGLARLHYDGSRGLNRDLKLAKKHFLMIARLYWSESGKVLKDASHVTETFATKSAGYLGRMFLRGEGMEQSYSKAKIWFTRGISNGDPLSHYSLGLMYLEGLGVDRDVSKAADYLSAAADQDLAVAQTALGVLFLDQGDPRAAFQYFELAARHGHIEAFYYLAEMNDKGIGRDRSCGMAAVYYKIVAEKAEAVWGSLGEANEAYEEGDSAQAIVRYLMAAEQGSESAQANAAWLLDHTQPRWSPITWLWSIQQSSKDRMKDAALALIYWTRSAKQHNTDSRVKMGDYYLAGMGTAASPDHAAACYQTAAEGVSVSAQALWNLGWMHENGVGIEQDFHLAKRMYDQALEANKEAYLPVQLSLWKLRWRSWWNGVTHGGVHGIEEDEVDGRRKPQSFSEWLAAFLEADAAYYEQMMEADDWEAQHDALGGTGGEYWDDGGDFEDGLLDVLLIGGLVAALGWLIWYRQQQRNLADQRRRQQEQQGQGALPQQAPVHPPVPGQQPDGGFFPQPGDPNWNAWVAGGVGH